MKVKSPYLMNFILEKHKKKKNSLDFVFILEASFPMQKELIFLNVLLDLGRNRNAVTKRPLNFGTRETNIYYIFYMIWSWKIYLSYQMKKSNHFFLWTKFHNSGKTYCQIHKDSFSYPVLCKISLKFVKANLHYFSKWSNI